ncbi:MAG: hypothetical protein RL095_3884 [Verrucomicrobiota bacterium]|jgi:TPR repeat protein
MLLSVFLITQQAAAPAASPLRPLEWTLPAGWKEGGAVPGGWSFVLPDQRVLIFTSQVAPKERAELMTGMWQARSGEKPLALIHLARQVKTSAGGALIVRIGGKSPLDAAFLMQRGLLWTLRSEGTQAQLDAAFPAFESFVLSLRKSEPFDGELERLHQATLKGDAGASVRLAEILLDGKFCKPVPELAEQVLAAAAKLGEPLANLRYGELLLRERGASAADPQGAYNAFKKAADGGLAQGLTRMGCLLISGAATGKPDLELGAILLSQAAEKDDAEAMLLLARLQLHGGKLGEIGRKRLEKAAGLGYAPAQAELGRLIRDGSLDGDRGHAEELFRSAIRQGHAGALLDLALMQKNPDEELRLVLLATERGNREALVHLAAMLLEGRGLSRSPSQAKALLGLAAQAGSVNALLVIGDLFEQGSGEIKADPAAALAEFRKAAAAGSAEGHYRAALLLLRSSPEQRPAALAALRDAAQAGHAAASRRLRDEQSKP